MFPKEERRKNDRVECREIGAVVKRKAGREVYVELPHFLITNCCLQQTEHCVYMYLFLLYCSHSCVLLATNVRCS